MPLILQLIDPGYGVNDVTLNTPNGAVPGKMLLLQDTQSGILVQVPLDEASARGIAAGLTGIVVATPGQVPPAVNGGS